MLTKDQLIEPGWNGSNFKPVDSDNFDESLKKLWKNIFMHFDAILHFV